MAKRRPSASTPISDAVLERLLFGDDYARRYTQDSSVLPQVWLHYAKYPGESCEQLLTPFQQRDRAYATDPTTLANWLVAEIRTARAAPGWNRSPRFKLTPEKKKVRLRTPPPPTISVNEGGVLAKIWFDELVRIVLPASGWWHSVATRLWKRPTEELAHTFTETPNAKPEDAKALLRNYFDTGTIDGRLAKLADDYRAWRRAGLRSDVLWVLNAIAVVWRRHTSPKLRKPLSGTQILQLVRELVTQIPPTGKPAMVHSVSHNRVATIAELDSARTVKADAARRVFKLDAGKIVWAVIDSGIDATHPAFRIRGDGGAPRPAPFELRKDPETDKPIIDNHTRIVKTYDFTLVRHILTPVEDDELPPETKAKLESAGMYTLEKVKDMRKALISGRRFEWTDLLPLIEVTYQKPDDVPIIGHGTHVAGILAGDWRVADPDPQPEESDFTGMCPELKLFDLRVFDGQGRSDEFTIMAALQFIRYFNSGRDVMGIHGVNLSLSLAHDKRNYACGCTPVCNECTRLVGSGVVVVAAAGNRGWTGPENSLAEGRYEAMSITDPGNTEAVITVGATHRDAPNTYGVSFFSSRGPTGDGRAKPDLVAPGEKIESTVPGAALEVKDGTSMAAPHVSGAAALIMARHAELIGRPERIKSILIKTATDLGRVRDFQGVGLLDTLRALQSV